MPLTFNAIFLGNSAVSLDPTEGNNVAENANLFVGQTFGGPGAALAGNWVSFTSVNNGGVVDALDMNNNVVNDQAIINNGSGPVTYVFDGTSVFNATITYIDGSTSASVPVVIVQMTNGDLYLVPSPTTPTPTNTALSSNQIRSVTLTSLVGNTYSGMGANRPLISFLTCFTPGTLIDTPEGLRAVETLQPGDKVVTKDRGAQDIFWVGRRDLSYQDLVRNPALRPVRIAAGALGGGLPARDLVVSPQHRVLVRSRIAARMFGQGEVLVAAKHLLGLPGIEVVLPEQGIAYLHFMCRRHEVVFAEGAATESLYAGPQAMQSMSGPARAELLALFPELMGEGARLMAPVPVRVLVTGRQGRSLTQRHLRNRQPLVA